MLKLEVGKRYLTKDGRTATITKYDVHGFFKYLGILENPDGPKVTSWSDQGYWTGRPSHRKDLVSEVL